MDLKLKSLIAEVERARNQFNNAKPEYQNIAIYELMAAEERLNQYIREMKEKEIKEKTFQPVTEKAK